MKGETEKWLRKAEEDLGTAEDCMKCKRFQATAFFSQQAAEKSLKALQIELHNRFSRVHDLLTLADSVKAPSEIINCCVKLNPFYTITRYPDVGEPITEETSQKMLDYSKKVLLWVNQTLKQ